MSFKEIWGQEKALNILKNALQSGRLAHAYLFVGPDGVGKRLTAFNLGKALNCLTPPHIGDCCDQCASCQKFNAGTHPDLIFTEPAGEVIKIGQLRDLQTRLRFRPWEGKARICILEAAESMNEEAANAFLKTLEEPPADTYFFLITSRPHMLLPTILSRCQWVKFQSLSQEIIARILIEKHSLPQDRAFFLSALGEGSVSRALIFSQSLEFSKRLEWLKMLDTLPIKSFREISAFSEELARNEQINDLLELWKIWVRDLALCKIRAEKTENFKLALINHDLEEQINGEAQQYSWSDLDFLFKRLVQGQKTIQYKVNPQLVLENLMLHIQKNLKGRRPANHSVSWPKETERK
ncbi:MAG: DNA polymerase III subunit delta' [Thermodesulfobacteriota bacterium]